MLDLLVTSLPRIKGSRLRFLSVKDFFSSGELFHCRYERIANKVRFTDDMAIVAKTEEAVQDVVTVFAYFIFPFA
jgi:hypothetical protein